ncbi:hypothetical protein AAMO2058_001142000 [Amorphochlora amoebiformis]
MRRVSLLSWTRGGSLCSLRASTKGIIGISEYGRINFSRGFASQKLKKRKPKPKSLKRLKGNGLPSERKEKKEKEEPLTHTQAMMTSLKEMTQQDIEKLEGEVEAEHIENYAAAGEELTPEAKAKIIQRNAVVAVSEILSQAEESIVPDKKAKYGDLPLDVDHFFAHLGLPEELKSYNKVIHACAMRGNIEMGLKALDDLRAAGFEPDVYTYTSLIRLQRANKGMAGVEQALRLKEEMFDNGVVPSVHTYGALIDICAKAFANGQVDMLLDEMKDIGLKPTPPICSTILNMHLDMGEHNKLWDTYYQMQYDGAETDEVTYNVLFKACARKREVEKGLMFLNDIKSDGITPGARAYNQCIWMCSQNPRHYLVGFNLFTEMVDAGHSPNSYTLMSLLACCARAGDVNNALRLTRQFIHTYGIILEAGHYELILDCIAESMTKENIKIFKKYKSDAEDHDDYPTNREVELSAPEKRAERIRLANAIFKDMAKQEIDVTSRVLNQYLRVHTCAAGPPVSMHPERPAEEFGTDKEIYFQFHTYHFMLKMYCRWPGEEQLLQEFKSRMEKDGIDLKVPDFIAMLERYDRQDHFQALLDTIEEMRERNLKVPKHWHKKGEETIRMVIEARERKKLDQAYEHFKSQDTVPFYKGHKAYQPPNPKYDSHIEHHNSSESESKVRRTSAGRATTNA